MEYKSSGSYGKRPLWQWILLYIIAGGIVYLLIYYFVFAKKGYNYGSGINYKNDSGQKTNSQW